ncbi:PAS domain-containing protein [Crossiella sp. CA-258035]|uniref:helix-turn-helix transcriptional regulator n=1 Tax=Crossiella sp. CA-258035 TaxID=2981138 RepID=UPI0024BBF965|nr:PAS domain-containing protein [Crossiella sp. CA-258035]WHT17530.1 PAS domain-containing protein [Crossiella sp. CA-258035]
MAERDAILAALRPVADGIVATFGACCEVVVHDFRRPANSVVAIAGAVTGRGVGGAMSEIGMGLLARGDDAEDQLNYITRTPEGKMVKSSTMLLRDSDNTVFGALCVNLDLTGLTQAQQLLGGLAGVDNPLPAPTTTFGDDIDAVIDSIVDRRQLADPRPWAELGRDERLALFQDLNEQGVFAVRRAVPRVASRLGISRASAYSYLAQIKENS